MRYIGIDPGTHTGLALCEGRNIHALKTLPIHRAMEAVLLWKAEGDVFVVFEDARQRSWFGKGKETSAKLQGAGSIKRDCTIWEDFLADHNIPFRAVPPVKGGTKLDEHIFRSITGYEGRSSNHARDAAMLVWGK